MVDMVLGGNQSVHVLLNDSYSQSMEEEVDGGGKLLTGIPSWLPKAGKTGTFGK